MKKRLEYYQTRIEKRLGECFTETSHANVLNEAIRYSLLGGGKRLRPALAIAFCEATGGNIEQVIDAACAVEFIHTYSLIHDDLPSMDDDDLRRGRPSNHKVYGEWMAILAGDALQAAAFEMISKIDLPGDRLLKIVGQLAYAAGEKGMCAGQVLDIQGERGEKSLTIEDLEITYRLKTGALISAAAAIGVLAAGGGETQLLAAKEYGAALGKAFQIRDDVLDAVSTEAVLGKPIGSDNEKGKTTFASLLTVEECQELIEVETKKAKKAIYGKFKDCEFLDYLADEMAVRAK